MYCILIRQEPEVIVIVNSGNFIQVLFLSLAKSAHSFAYLNFSTIIEKHKM